MAYRLQQCAEYILVSLVCCKYAVWRKISGFRLMGERSACQGQNHILRVHFSCLTKTPGHGYGAILGINTQGLPLKPSTIQLWGVNTPKDIFISGYKIFFQHPCSPIAFVLIVLHVRAVKARGGQLLHVFIIKMFAHCTDALELNS